MTTNGGAAVAQLRQPRGIVQINGTAVPFVAFEVNNNVFYAADTFRVTLSPSALPEAMNLGALAGGGDLMVQIWAGFPSDPTNYTTSGLTSLIYGKADAVSWHIDGSENVVEINGRDLTAAMIDTKTVQKYPNLTSSVIAAQIAGNHGLQTSIKATTTKVGRYYEIDHIQLQDDRTEWDLLTYLARQEGFVCYVQDQTLHFEPAPSGAGTPYVFQITPPSATAPASANFTSLKVEHAKTLANDVKVVLHSWDRKHAKGYTVTATASHTKSGFANSKNSVPAGSAQIYSRTVPHMSKADLQMKANQMLAEITRHEMKIEVEGPADVQLGRTDPIQLKGTGTPFDQTYYPSSITRSLSVEGGFSWRIAAKNQSPESSVVV